MQNIFVLVTSIEEIHSVTPVDTDVSGFEQLFDFVSLCLLLQTNRNVIQVVANLKDYLPSEEEREISYYRARRLRMRHSQEPYKRKRYRRATMLTRDSSNSRDMRSTSTIFTTEHVVSGPTTRAHHDVHE